MWKWYALKKLRSMVRFISSEYKGNLVIWFYFHHWYENTKRFNLLIFPINIKSKKILLSLFTIILFLKDSFIVFLEMEIQKKYRFFFSHFISKYSRNL